MEEVLAARETRRSVKSGRGLRFFDFSQRKDLPTRAWGTRAPRQGVCPFLAPVAKRDKMDHAHVVGCAMTPRVNRGRAASARFRK